jgi:hypothetical protein
MNEEKQTLSEFLRHQQLRYCNSAGVSFYMFADGSLYVAARYPGVEETAEISLDFFQQFDNVTQFMSLLHISYPEGLADVVPEDLYSLYKGELLDIVCTIKGSRTRNMSFRKIGGMLWAINTKKKIHLVRLPVHQPEDYIAYTLRYYNRDVT